MVFTIAGLLVCLIAHTGNLPVSGLKAAPGKEVAQAPVTERLVRLDERLSIIEKEVDQASMKLDSVRDDTTELKTEMKFVMWLGSGIGVVLLGVAGKLFLEPKNPLQIS